MKYLFVVSLFAVTALGSAQTKHDPFDLHAANIRLLEQKVVQKELGITDAQRAKMNKHADAQRARLQAYAAELKSKGTDTSKVKQPDARVKAMIDDLRLKVFGELSAAQLKRLREISLQIVGLVSMLDSTVAKRVGLSSAQLTKLRDLYQAGSKQADSLIETEARAVLTPYQKRIAAAKTQEEKQKLSDEAKSKLKAAQDRVKPKVEKIRSDTQTKMLAVITKPQQTAFLALQGKRFKPSA